MYTALACGGCGHGKVKAKLELEDLDLILRERAFAGLGMCSVLVVQSEQHVINRLMASRGAGKPKLTWKKLTENGRSRQIRCEICYACR